MSREELMAFYADVIRTPADQVPAGSPVIQAYEMTESGHKIRIADKIAAGAALSRMCDWNSPERLEVSSDSLTSYSELSHFSMSRLRRSNGRCCHCGMERTALTVKTPVSEAPITRDEALRFLAMIALDRGNRIEDRLYAIRVRSRISARQLTERDVWAVVAAIANGDDEVPEAKDRFLVKPLELGNCSCSGMDKRQQAAFSRLWWAARNA
jgi:hypothetical protein